MAVHGEAVGHGRGEVLAGEVVAEERER